MLTKPDTPDPAQGAVSWRLRPSLSSLEIWGFGCTGFLVWLGIAPSVHAALGPQAIFVWLPLVVVGIMINLQVRRLAVAWPEMAGGTPNYTARLLQNYPLLARYSALSYFQGWASVPTVSAIILSHLIMNNVVIPLHLDFPEWPIKISLTVFAFVVAFAGTRALSVLQLFFVIPAMVLLLVFCVQGLAWLSFSPDSRGLLPLQWGEFNFREWAIWYFVATYAAYGMETASAFMVDGKKPLNTQRCLSAVAMLLPFVFIGGAWILMRLANTPHNNGDVYNNLVRASHYFWGTPSFFLAAFMITAGLLTSCVAGCANSPRMIYQMAVNGQAAPVFQVVSRRNIPGPALVLTILVSLVFLLWGDLTHVLIISSTGYFFSFIAFHLGLWLNRDKPEVRWPRWSLLFFIAEIIIFVAGGWTWNWQDFLIGLLFPLLIMAVDSLVQWVPNSIFQPAWWMHFYRARPYEKIRDNVILQIILLFSGIASAVAMGWGAHILLDSVQHEAEVSASLLAILIQLSGFFGVAIACWSTLPQLATISEAREQAVLEAHHLLQTARDAILVINNRGVVRLANPAAETLLGLGGGQIIGKKLDEFIPDVQPERSEYTLPHKDGSWRTVEVAISKISDSNLNEHSVILHDITERKNADKTLGQMAAIVEFSEDAVIGLTLQGEITAWNNGAEKIFGYTAAEIKGRAITLFSPPNRSDEIPPLLEKIRAGENTRNYETIMQRKDAKHIDVSITLSPIRDSGSQITGISIIARDITERKQNTGALYIAQKIALLANEAANVEDAMKIGIKQICVYASWIAGHVYFVDKNNPATLLPAPAWYLSDPERLDKFCSVIHAPQLHFDANTFVQGQVVRVDDADKDAADPRTQQARAVGITADFCFPIFIGSEMAAVLECFATDTASITPRLLNAVSHVATQLGRIIERKTADEQLKKFATQLDQSNRELQDFASIAAHDLQEPLRKISAFGDRLQSACGESLSEQGRDYLKRMQNASERMQALINDLLTLSRVTSKGQPFVPTDLAQSVREVLSDMEIRIEQCGGRVELGELPTIDADPSQMRQLLQNLIGNALKFKGEAAPVVKIYQQSSAPNTCTILVEDNGIGFDEKYLDRIFIIFERLHSRSDYEGTGIGLAVCRKIVERHGGTITARSTPGQGATFMVTLPLKQVKTQ
ncbi:MAG: PAS domain S-box protein [Gallionellaceae bacterium]|nr:PAS domain S-box protein [Gallionellaceae bacterium]